MVRGWTGGTVEASLRRLKAGSGLPGGGGQAGGPAEVWCPVIRLGAGAMAGPVGRASVSRGEVR